MPHRVHKGLFVVKELPWVKDFKKELKLVAVAGDDVNGGDNNGGKGGNVGKSSKDDNKSKKKEVTELVKRNKKTLTDGGSGGSVEDGPKKTEALLSTPSSQSSPPSPSPSSSLPPLTAADWNYSDIMSKEWGLFLVLLALLSGYLSSPIMLTVAFSAALATIIGAPDPRKRRAYDARNERRRKRREAAGLDPRDDNDEDGNGDNDDDDDDDEREFETDAGLRLSEWMAGKTQGGWSLRGMGKRNNVTGEEEEEEGGGVGRNNTEPLLSDEGMKTQQPKKAAQASRKIRKLSKLD